MAPKHQGSFPLLASAKQATDALEATNAQGARKLACANQATDALEATNDQGARKLACAY